MKQDPHSTRKHESGPHHPLAAPIFCRSCNRVEGVACDLASTLGWDRVGAYHAGMTKEERTAVERWFFSATDAVLVAMTAYGIPQVPYIGESSTELYCGFRRLSNCQPG